MQRRDAKVGQASMELWKDVARRFKLQPQTTGRQDEEGCKSQSYYRACQDSLRSPNPEAVEVLADFRMPAVTKSLPPYLTYCGAALAQAVSFSDHVVLNGFLAPIAGRFCFTMSVFGEAASRA